MNDLIWIGNTLYPRWFVYLVMFTLLLVASGMIAAFIAWVSKT